MDIKDGNVYATNGDFAGTIHVDTIDEYTTDNGICIEGCELKDGVATFGQHQTGQNINMTWIVNSDTAANYGSLDFKRYPAAGVGNAVGAGSIIREIRDYAPDAGGTTRRRFETRTVVEAQTVGADTCSHKWYQRFGGADSNLVLEVNTDGTIDIPFGLYVDTINEYGTGGVTIEGINIDDNVTLLGDGGTTDYLQVAADGVVTAYGDARWVRKYSLPLGAISAPGSSPATLVQVGLNGAYSYSKTVNNYTSVEYCIPHAMDRTVPLVVRVPWATAATTGNVQWKMDLLWTGDGDDVTTTTPDETITVTTDLSTVGVANARRTATFNFTSTPASGDTGFVLRLYRDVSVASNADAVAYTTRGSVLVTEYRFGEPV